MSRILIVDDEPLVLAGYVRELRNRFDLRTAADSAVRRSKRLRSSRT